MKQNDVVAFFDRLAPSWDADMVRSDRIIGEILDAAGISEGVTVLDVGCGTGVLIPDYLSRNVRSVTGVDISPAMLGIARRKFTDPRVSFVCADAAEIVLPTVFDCCVVYNAFPHFPDPAKLVLHLAELLAPSGRLTIAHGMSRAAIDAHHSGAANGVSFGLMDAHRLAGILDGPFRVDVIVSDDEKYIVSGVKTALA